MATLKIEDLVSAAKNLQELLGCQPPLDPNAKEDTLKKSLLEAAELLTSQEIEQGFVVVKKKKVLIEDTTISTLAKLGAGGFGEGEEPEEEETQTTKKEEKSMNKKATKEQSKTKPSVPKKEVGKSCYGHRVGTVAALVDELFYKGTTTKNAIKAILKAFPEKDERLARNKIKVHFKYLIKKGIKGTYDEKRDFYKTG